MGEVLPLALGIAASPFPVIPAILLLFTPRPRATAGAFLAGWLLGVGVATSVAVVLAEVVELAEGTPTWAAWTRIVLGVALIGYGARLWVGRDDAGELPGWMRTLQEARPATALRLALLLSLANPKIVLLAVAAGLAIGTASSGTSGDVGAVVVFTLVASVSVALPLLLHLALGERVLGPLGRAKDWLTAHHGAVMAVVLVVLGVLVLVKGVQGR